MELPRVRAPYLLHAQLQLPRAPSLLLLTSLSPSSGGTLQGALPEMSHEQYEARNHHFLCNVIAAWQLTAPGSGTDEVARALALALARCSPRLLPLLFASLERI